MTKLFGDVSEADRKIEQDLIGAEEAMEAYRHLTTGTKLAKCWVALAHDYYKDIGLDEEGERLIAKALKDCPTYFTVEIYEDRKADPMFDAVVVSLGEYLRNHIA